MTIGLTEIAIVILLAAALGIIAKLLGQPTILAYLIAGGVIGFLEIFHIGNLEIFHLFSDMGIMFLLFLVGLEIDYSSVKLVGKDSVIVGSTQLAFTTLLGFALSSLLGYDLIPSLYIAAAIAFSSTIVVVQLLSDKRDLNSLYGKLSIGFLLVQDFVAILILVVLSGLEAGGGFEIVGLLLTILKGLALFAAMFYLGRKIFPYVFSKIAHSQELLFLSSLAWLFSFAAIVEVIGFSVEIGGFLAGIALANSSEHYEISSRVRPLRDFFILMFFAILGSSMVLVFANFTGLIVPILVLSAFVLIGNPIVILTIMGLMGYEKRTSFMFGVTIAQISEFSLILAAMGLKVGHINEEIVALITALGVVTFTLSAYLITNAEKIFRLVSPYLSIFEKTDTKKIFMPTDDTKKPVIIIGFHRTGRSIASDLNKDDLLVVDFDPSIISELKKAGYSCLFGDVTDFEVFEKIDFSSTEVLISTNPQLRDNLILLNEVKRAVKNAGLDAMPKMILRANNEHEAQDLYEAGADYVLVPQFISGHYLSRVINRGEDLSILKQLKERDLRVMAKDRIK